MKSAEKKVTKRIWEIDFIRGIAIFLMILDHLCYDFATMPYFFKNFTEINNRIFLNIMDFFTTIFYSDVRYVFHCIFVAVFFLICGISSSFSKNNLKRGVIIILTCLLLDIVTYAIYFISQKSIDVRMIFNVLLPLGLGILCLYLIDKIPHNKYICLSLGIIIILIGFIFNLFKRPIYYNEFDFHILFDILISKVAFGSDCFGIIPYIGFVFLGSFIGKTLYKNKESALNKLDGKWNKFFCYIGKNTLIIYLLHQLALALFVGLICLIVGYRF